MKNNANLHNAKSAKNDEFYTQLVDVEKELKHYKAFFNGKKVLCNCNDDKWSAFFKYFSMNFEHLGLKQLVCVSYNENGNGKKYTYNGDLNGNRIVDDWEVNVTELNSNGSYSSDECIELLKDCDVVVTNPPFSLFRDFVSLLYQYNKKFLIIGNVNAVTYKEIFPLIKENKMWLVSCLSVHLTIVINVLRMNVRKVFALLLESICLMRKCKQTTLFLGGKVEQRLWITCKWLVNRQMHERVVSRK